MDFNLMQPYQPGWAVYRLPGLAAKFIDAEQVAPHANTGGVTAGTEGIPTGGTTTVLDTFGAVADPASPTAQMDAVLTALVIRETVDVLRDKAVIVQEGAFLHAQHVKGTKNFTYTAFADIGAAEDLLEGVPPETEGLTWDTFSFTGKQKGKLVAITDLAEMFNPFDLYSKAAEKIAWNIVDTAEIGAMTLLNSDPGVTIAAGKANIAANIIDAVVTMKIADIPTFPDRYYHVLISPTDAAAVMGATGELGWTDTMKYTQGEALLNGELGRFRGARFIESNRVTDGQSIIYGPGAFVWGDLQTVQSYRVAPGGNHADPLAQRGLVGWKGMWGMSLVAFDGTPAMGPTTNTEGFRFGQVDLVTTA